MNRFLLPWKILKSSFCVQKDIGFGDTRVGDPVTFMTYNALCYRRDIRTNDCKASLKDLHEETGLPKKKIARGIKKLIKYGYVKKLHRWKNIIRKYEVVLILNDGFTCK